MIFTVVFDRTEYWTYDISPDLIYGHYFGNFQTRVQLTAVLAVL